MNHLPLLLALLVVLSGCTFLGSADPGEGTPTPTGTPTTTPAPVTESPTATPTPAPTPDPRDLAVVLRGNGSAPYTVTLLLVDAPVERVTVRYANGTERSFDASARGDLPAGVLDGALSLSPNVPVEREVSYTEPSPDDGAELGIPTTASDVFYYVTVDGTVHDWDAVTCGDGDVTRLDLTVHGAGVSTGNVGCAL